MPTLSRRSMLRTVGGRVAVRFYPATGVSMPLKPFRFYRADSFAARRDQGFSLTEILICVAILGAIGALAAAASSGLFATIADANTRMNIERQRFHLRIQTSCARTIPTGTCGALGTSLDVRDKSDKLVLANTGTTRIGGTFFRAVCAGSHEIRFEFKPANLPTTVWSPLFWNSLICPLPPT